MPIVASRRGSRAARLAVVLSAVAVLAAVPANAFVQSTTDPSDAPSGAQGETDLRSVTWDVHGSTAVLSVAVDESTYGAGIRAEIGVHVLIDADRDGVADAEADAARNADGLSIDWTLRTLDRTQSTGDCQDLDGTTSGTQATVATTVADGLERFSFTFDPSDIVDGLAWFRWAAFGQSPADPATAGPWDYLPDAANPEPAAANPGDRRCDASKTGIAVRMSSGVDADTVAPVTSASVRAVPTGDALGEAKVPVRFHWRGTDNATPTGSLHYDVQLRDTAGAAWAPVVTDGKSVAATRLLVPGHTYLLRHRARDAGDNKSAYTVSDPFRVKVVTEKPDAPVLRYRGDWTRVARAGAYGGHVATTKSEGARVIATFHGRFGVGVVMPRRSSLGVVKVCLSQGTKHATCSTVDLGAGASRHRLLIWARNGLDPSLDTTVRITDVRGRIDFDALELLS
jgi:hypothetical protein